MPFTVEGEIRCERDGCTASEPVTITLGNMGISRPIPDGWQDSAGIRCPEHRRGGAGLDSIGRYSD